MRFSYAWDLTHSYAFHNFAYAKSLCLDMLTRCLREVFGWDFGAQTCSGSLRTRLFLIAATLSEQKIRTKKTRRWGFVSLPIAGMVSLWAALWANEWADGQGDSWALRMPYAYLTHSLRKSLTIHWDNWGSTQTQRCIWWMIFWTSNVVKSVSAFNVTIHQLCFGPSKLTNKCHDDKWWWDNMDLHPSTWHDLGQPDGKATTAIVALLRLHPPSMCNQKGAMTSMTGWNYTLQNKNNYKMKVQHRNPTPYATRILNTSLRILTQLKVLLTHMDDMTSQRTNQYMRGFGTCSGDLLNIRDVSLKQPWWNSHDSYLFSVYKCL